MQPVLDLSSECRRTDEWNTFHRFVCLSVVDLVQLTCEFACLSVFHLLMTVATIQWTDEWNTYYIFSYSSVCHGTLLNSSALRTTIIRRPTDSSTPKPYPYSQRQTLLQSNYFVRRGACSISRGRTPTSSAKIRKEKVKSLPSTQFLLYDCSKFLVTCEIRFYVGIHTVLCMVHTSRRLRRLWRAKRATNCHHR